MRRLVALLAAGMVLAGCATIPTSGPVLEGPRLEGESSDQIIRVIARPPQPGMTPAQVVTGFVQASASFDDDHAVARLYLTPEAAAAWRPEAGTTVYDGTPTISVEGPVDAESGASTTVELSAAEAGRISDDGRYQVSAPSRRITPSFLLTSINGQWRIASPPSGLLLSRADVDRAFRSYSVYFFDPSFTTVVPDPRLFPVSGQGAATTLTRALINGPSDWLAPAVRTAFPDGSSLLVDAVPVTEGIARIDLDALTRLTDDATRQAMSAQLSWTLRQIPSIEALDINAGGQILQVPGVAVPQPIDSWPLVDPNRMPTDTRAYVVAGTGVRQLTDSGSFPVPGAAGDNDPALTGIAVDLVQSRVTGLDERAALWTATLTVSGGALEIVPEPGQSRPTYGGRSQPWFVGSDGVIRRINDEGVPAEVAIEGLSSRNVVESIAMSRDGTRAALVTRRGPRAVLLLAVVVPREGGYILSSPVRVESRLNEFIDVVWGGTDRLVALAAEGAGAQQVYEIDLARSSVRSLGAPESPIRIAAAPGLPILVGTGDGVVMSGTGSTWEVVSTGGSPAYPGN